MTIFKTLAFLSLNLLLFSCTKTTDDPSQNQETFGQVYWHNGDTLYASDPQTGAITKNATKISIYGTAPHDPFIISDGVFYQPTLLQLRAIKFPTGQPFYTHFYSNATGSSASMGWPVVSGNQIYAVGTTDTGYVLAAHNKMTGAVNWSKKIDVGGGHIKGHSRTPVVSGNRIMIPNSSIQYVFSNGTVIPAVNAVFGYNSQTGELLWKTVLSNTNGYLGTQPLIYDSTKMLVSDVANKKLYCINILNGSVLWTTTLALNLLDYQFFLEGSKLTLVANSDPLDRKIAFIVVDLQSGNVTRTFLTQDVEFHYVEGDFAYTTNNINQLTKYRISNGTVVWKEMGTTNAKMVFTPDFIYHMENTPNPPFNNYGIRSKETGELKKVLPSPTYTLPNLLVHYKGNYYSPVRGTED